MLNADQKPTDQATTAPAVDESLHDAPLDQKLAATDEKAAEASEQPTAEQLQAPDAAAASATDANPNPAQPELDHAALVEDGKQPDPNAKVTAVDDDGGPKAPFVPPAQAASPDQVVGKGAPEATSGAAAATADQPGSLEERMATLEKRVATALDENQQTLHDLRNWLQNEMTDLRGTLQERHENYLSEFGRDQESIEAEADAAETAERPHVEDRLAKLEETLARIEPLLGKLKHFA